MYKVAAYTRVSGEKTESILLQKKMMEDYILNKGWNLSKLYIDRKKGSESERPELLRLLEDIKNGAIDILVVNDITRLGRNQDEVNRILSLLNEKRVKFISLDGRVNTLGEVDKVFSTKITKQTNNQMGESTMRVATYTRVSGKKTESILSQKKMMQDYPLNKGWSTEVVYR